jgi:PIN domain nuclease of toxin-antitoxin system
MKILIDTHALLWLITDNKKLSKNSKIYFTDPKNELYFSMASFWEICIKVSIGKLSLSTNWEQTIKEELNFNSVQLLPISTKHCIQVNKLPFHHRDPFDRLIIAQAVVEEFHVMSIDEHFVHYPISLIW